MPVNALRQMQWNFEVPDVNRLIQPIQAGYEGYRRDQQQAVENERQNKLLQLQQDQFGLQQRRADREDDAAKVVRLGKEASAIHQMQGPQRAAAWRAWTQSNADAAALMPKFGIDPSDHVKGPEFIAIQAGQFDPMERRKQEAELGRINAVTSLAGAQAGYYGARTKAALHAPSQPAAADPLAGAGIDENGNMISPSHGHSRSLGHLPPPNPSADLQSSGVPGLSIAPGGPNFSGRMNLGGPVDDIERSMRIDEGRATRPQGVQLAQATPPNWRQPSGAFPDPLAEARNRSFGPAGVVSPDVAGIVTDAGRNRRMDVPATREAQGHRAFDAASPDQQQRLLRLRQEQAFWTNAYGRPPRAGFYYGPDGREMALTDKNFKGDRESQAVALLNMNKIEAASKRLIEQDYFRRTALGALNVGEVGQAFADMKQGALGIAYALSGKTVAVAEMKNFIEAYGPVPGDGEERIKQKTQRMRDFYQALLTASRGGEPYETAFSRAMSVTGLKNPDGSPAGQPAAASSGAPPASPAQSRLKSKYGLE